jgi:hypothetical protein
MHSPIARRSWSIILLAITAASALRAEPLEFLGPSSESPSASAVSSPVDELNSESLFRGAATLAVAAPSASVGMFGDSSKIRFEGVESFEADDLRWAIAANMTYQAAARPSGDLAALLQVLEACIATGYQHCGFPDATASASYGANADEIVVRVHEGPRFRAGEVRVEGARPELARELIARLQSPTAVRPWVYRLGEQALNSTDADEDKWPWKPGEPAPCDRRTLDAVSKRVVLELADIGYPFARFTVRPVPSGDSEKSDLVIDVAEEGRRAEFDEIEIQGLTRHTAEEVCKFLGLEQGMKLSGGECDRICAALRDSCRFWKSAVEVRLSESGGDRYGGLARSAKLRISVEEYELAPKLSEPLSPIDQCLVRTAAWLQNFWNVGGTEELQFMAAIGEEEALKSTGGAVRILIARDRGCLIQAKGKYGIAEAEATCILDGDKTTLMDWRSGQKFSLEGAHTPTLNLDINTAEKLAADEYKTTIRFGLGLNSEKASSSNAPRIWSASIDPVAVVHAAHRKGATASLKGGVLKIECDGWSCHIDEATGRIVHSGRNSPESRWTFGEAEEQFDDRLAEVMDRSNSLEETFDPAAPLASVAGFAATSLLTQTWVQDEPLARMGCEKLAAAQHAAEDPAVLLTFYHQLFPAAKHADQKDRQFRIPHIELRLGDNEWAGCLVPIAPALADLMFPRGSWPWTWLRELAFEAAGNSEGDPYGTASDGGFGRELNRVIPEASHLGRLVMIRWSPRRLAEKNVPAVARIALQCSEKDFEDEVNALVHGEHGFAQLCRGAIRVLEDMDGSSRTTLLEGLPDPWLGIVVQLIGRRAEAPTELREDALEGVLLRAWNDGGRAAVQAALDSLARHPETGPPPEMAQSPSESMK